ncbi:MAG: outer membrane protein assembly factor BamA [Pseudohongiellaceae bacterium]|jgi:outer membrane protein assembly factor BamA
MAIRQPLLLLAAASCCNLLFSPALYADHAECKPGTGQTTPPKNVNIKSIDIENFTIFEIDDQSIWLHRLANDLHINTKPHIIESRLSFEEGDDITLEDVQESERLLRKLSYIRDAKVELSTDCNHHPDGVVKVKTWDHWTLYPRVNFSRSGGENKYSYGIQDDNLLGLGIQSNFKYFSDGDRAGYGIKLSAPITSLRHSTLSMAAFNNDDGYRYAASLRKPFYTLNSTKSYYFNSEHHEQDLHIDQNGNDDDENVFKAQQTFFEAGYGWSEGKVNNWVSRITLGFTSNEESFAPTDDVDSVTLATPNDREFVYPWAQFQVIENDYEVIPDVHFIQEKEDHHLGWQHIIRLGIETDDSDNQDDLAGHLRTHSTKGLLSGKHLVFGSVSTALDFGVANSDYYKVATGLEYFYNWNPSNKLYLKTELTLSDNNYLDRPITLGGEISDDDNDFEITTIAQPTVRGYPAQYQQGSNRWQTSLEARHYPGIELYRLVRIAWVAFFDAGRAWGGDNITTANEESSALASFGFGVRMASIRSSGRNVIHFDVAKTLTSGANVDSWGIRVHAKQRF